jgi:hypothetical protein
MTNCGKFKPDLLQEEDEVHEYINNYNKCLLGNINVINKNMSKNINQYQDNNDRLTTSTEVNNDTMKMYINDYYYVITKGIIYSITLIIFIYFFGINNLIEGIKVTGTVIKDKAVMIKDKAEEMKNKIKE